MGLGYVIYMARWHSCKKAGLTRAAWFPCGGDVWVFVCECVRVLTVEMQNMSWMLCAGLSRTYFKSLIVRGSSDATTRAWIVALKTSLCSDVSSPPSTGSGQYPFVFISQVHCGNKQFC